MRNLTHFLNYTYVIFVVLWDPLHNTIITLDSKQLGITILTIVVFLINFITSQKFKQFLFSKPIIFWGIWVIFSCINLKISGYNGELPYSSYIILELFSPFLTMLIVCVELFYNHKKISHTLFAVFCIYGLFATFLSTGLGNFTGEQNLGPLGNLGSLNIMFIIFYASLLYAHKWLKTRSLIFYTVISTSLILTLATRKAFGAALIMVIFAILSQIKISIKNLWKLIVFIILIIYSIDLVLNNTLMGTRLTNTIDVGQKFNTTDNETLNFLGDRAFYYIEGWNIFLENPLTGIGLNNFTKETGTNYRIHSEYMVQLTEGGIIGCTFFLLFYLWIFRNLYKRLKEKNRDKVFMVLTGGFIAIIFINLTAWTYAFPHYFACLGIIIGYLKMIPSKKVNKIHANNLLN